ncbi:MAG: endonuclease/exonuclease/phosphatase family protein [Microcoleaceae cyanobacterium]
MKSLLTSILLGLGLLIAHPIAASPPQTLDVLSYNIYMRPRFLFFDGQEIQADLLPNKIQGYDVIIFQEAFDDRVRNNLPNRLNNEYPYKTKILGSDKGIRQDGGVIMVSQWPIKAQYQRLFSNICAAEDCLADKGVLYAQINKQGQIYHLFGTHIQSGRNKKPSVNSNFI